MVDENAMERTPMSVRAHGDDSRSVDPQVQNSLDALAIVFDRLRGLCPLPPAESLEFVLADDLSEAVRELAGHMVGVEDLINYEVERIGGLVAGKTMFRDEAHRRIVIVLDEELFRSSEPVDRVVQWYLVAHELAHGLIGQLRSTERPPMEPTGLPWEASHWLARYALEEYLADSVAELLLRQLGHATDTGGESHPLSTRMVLPRSEQFVTAALEQLIVTVARIHQYRLDGELEGMWVDVQSATSQILITLAHAQAEIDDPTAKTHAAVTLARSEEFGPLHECWDTMHKLFASFPLISSPPEFAQLEPDAFETGGDLIVELWRNLGLTFRPEGDGFYITVSGPEEVWSGFRER